MADKTYFWSVMCMVVLFLVKNGYIFSQKKLNGNIFSQKKLNFWSKIIIFLVEESCIFDRKNLYF